LKRIRGINPTLKQAMIIQDNGHDYRDYLVKKVLSDRLEIVHRFTGESKNAFFETVKV